MRSIEKNERHGDGSLHVYWAKWSAQNSDRVLGTEGTSLIVTVLMSLLNLRLRPRLRRFHTGLGILVDVDTSNWTGRRYPNIPESDQAWNVFGWWCNAKKLDLDRPSVYALNMKVWHSEYMVGQWMNGLMNNWMKKYIKHKHACASKVFPWSFLVEFCFNDKIAKSSETQFYENFTKNKWISLWICMWFSANFSVIFVINLCNKKINK